MVEGAVLWKEGDHAGSSAIAVFWRFFPRKSFPAWETGHAGETKLLTRFFILGQLDTFLSVGTYLPTFKISLKTAFDSKFSVDLCTYIIKIYKM